MACSFRLYCLFALNYLKTLLTVLNEKMTRFARAKGSKSSNEKAPEDSTPWEVMKEQLLEAKKNNEDSRKRQEAENQRLENYQNFLKEQKIQKKKASWCDFPETEQTQYTLQPPNKKKKKKSNNDVTESPVDTETCNMKQKSKKKNKKTKSELHTEVKQDESDNKTEQNISNKSVKKQKNKKAKNLDNDSENQNGPALNSTNSDTTIKNQDISNNMNKSPQKQKKKKPTKFVDGKPVRRKEINDNSFQLIINGKEVELIRFDGFPIMKKDAERLSELKKSMLNKGIPKSEVQRTMKLERRRAEKALARLKKEVCYNCRKGGHNLSDCPDLKSKIPGLDAAEGVCFKCGSTEHKQFECKVQKDGAFKFATCFICKEPGHIARQCPDNPKGLYPNGGSCKLCGDVTHLRKDCPTVNDQKEEKSIKLQTLDDDNIEDVGVQMKTKSSDAIVKKPKKIKF